MTSPFGYTPAVFVSTEQRHEFLQFAQQAARLAGAVVLPHFRTTISAQNKVVGKGNALGFARVYIDMNNGRLEEVIRIEAQENNIIAAKEGVRLVLKTATQKPKLIL